MADTEILTVDPAAPAAGAMAHAGAVLRSGRLVAFPTETVYGVGADALNPDAVRAIFEAKGRPSYNPLIVHVASAAAARALVSDWPPLAERAASAFWPGPLTLVLPKAPSVPDEVTAGLGTVGVRVPSHPVALAFLRAAGVPVAAPSANLFTRLSPTTAQHVLRGLSGRIDLLVDGGATPIGIESTVLDVSGQVPALLRPGVIGLDELERVLGAVQVASPLASDGDVPRSPGMIDRHYSPAARLVVFSDSGRARHLGDSLRSEGHRIGALVRHSFRGRADEVLVLPDEPMGFARLLYASLHALDDAGCDIVLVEDVPRDEAWRGVRDRIARAANG
jgi:L-threonylcarbamoyladenylate synthase